MSGYYNKDDLRIDPHKRNVFISDDENKKESTNVVEINYAERYNGIYQNNQYNYNKDYGYSNNEIQQDFDIINDVQEDSLRDSARIKDLNELSKEEIPVSRKIIIGMLAMMALVIVVAVVLVFVQPNTEAEGNKSKVEVASGKEAEIEMVDESELDEIEQIEVEYQSSNDGNADDGNEYTLSEEEIRSGVEKLSRKDKRVKTIIDNYDQYPVGLMKDIVRNKEMIDYALGYLDGIKKTYNENIDISKEINDVTYPIPLLIQWDERWGYYSYGKSTVGISGCGPTALNMVYIGLTGDVTMNPLKMAKFSTDYGYCVPGVGTSWSLMIEGANRLGLTSARLSNKESSLIQSLQEGKYVIASMGPGIFTTNGHFIVISGYEDGKFRINDPFCIEHSKRKWDYSEFSNQVKAFWVLSKQ